MDARRSQLSDKREARQYGAVSGSGSTDTRTPFQRDRDRILYSDYFRRLAGVTQVVSASEGGIFHNRLTHSLKVSQVARRLAERITRECPKLVSDLDADVVEAAALAHDLGHPPFGHAGEKELNKVAESFKLEDGFEGNAQTFRILTRLAVHRSGQNGLNLTRATLCATLKYPWLRAKPNSKNKYQRAKYSAYNDDTDAFDFARKLIKTGEEKCLEAQVMDLADSITYSVHDLEDFFRAGLIPIERIVRNGVYRTRFLNRWRDEAAEKSDRRKVAAQEYARDPDTWQQIGNLLELMLSEVPEPGTQREAELLEGFRSTAITRFLGAITVTEGGKGSRKLQMDDAYVHQCSFLQRLTWDYVIRGPRLATQQAGQVRVVRELAQFFRTALKHKTAHEIPTRFRERAKSVWKNGRAQARLAIDIVASLTEAEAVALFRRVMGHNSGSLLDLVH